MGKTSPRFWKQWNTSLWVSPALKGISLSVTLILGRCHLCHPPTLFFSGPLSGLPVSWYPLQLRVQENILNYWRYRLAGWTTARLGNFPAVERSVLQSHCARLQSWRPHTIMHILLSVHNHLCHLQTLHIHAVAPVALVGKLGKYLQSSFRWDKELEFQERCDQVAGDPALCRWAGTSGAPVGHKAQSALESGSPAVNVKKPNEAKTCRVHPASRPALLRKQVAGKEGTLQKYGGHSHVHC